MAIVISCEIATTAEGDNIMLVVLVNDEQLYAENIKKNWWNNISLRYYVGATRLCVLMSGTLDFLISINWSFAILKKCDLSVKP